MNVIGDIRNALALMARAPQLWLGLCLVATLAEFLLISLLSVFGHFLTMVLFGYFAIVMATHNCSGTFSPARIDWSLRASQFGAVFVSGAFGMAVFLLVLLPFGFVFMLALGGGAEPGMDQAEAVNEMLTLMERAYSSPGLLLFMFAGTAIAGAAGASRFVFIPVIAIAWQTDFTAARATLLDRFRGLRTRVFPVFALCYMASMLVGFAAGGTGQSTVGVFVSTFAGLAIGNALPLVAAVVMLYRASTGGGSPRVVSVNGENQE
ncbi:MAG: hypothetical protein VYB54_00615 [Pseudomonadota bacterium]|nr:hypothetical protein [Pseudomonadota bacterium]